MSDILISYLGIACILLLLAARVPIAFALGSVSFVGICLVRSPRAAFGTMASMPFDFASSWSFRRSRCSC